MLNRWFHNILFVSLFIRFYGSYNYDFIDTIETSNKTIVRSFVLNITRKFYNAKNIHDRISNISFLSKKRRLKTHTLVFLFYKSVLS